MRSSNLLHGDFDRFRTNFVVWRDRANNWVYAPDDPSTASVTAEIKHPTVLIKTSGYKALLGKGRRVRSLVTSLASTQT